MTADKKVKVKKPKVILVVQINSCLKSRQQIVNYTRVLLIYFNSAKQYTTVPLKFI